MTDINQNVKRCCSSERNRTGEVVEIIKELNEQRYIIECKNTYELTVGIENKPMITTARKIDLEIIKED